ncbi:hypothetical protein CYMTET_26742 [Cymbomonas tetramitiformis]|uniref:Uncharacterized protein n=1 Tax=Cymbomonas tetramitiformis TaxID=36881 RepID=A0AAE0FRX0_9CHLO|nr:hypothetical protein CYMTET_26742 [Cymbomonas tetramitiformis]
MILCRGHLGICVALCLILPVAHGYDGVRLLSDSGVTKPLQRQLSKGFEANLAEMDADCHGEAHAGYEGHAFTWGMSFKTASAAECCAACKAHQKICGDQDDPSPVSKTFFHASSMAGSTNCGGGTGPPAYQSCNVFIFCPEPLCWANDVHNHTFGECWLKFQDDPARPKSPSRGRYPPHVRNEHRTVCPPHPSLFPSPSPKAQQRSTHTPRSVTAGAMTQAMTYGRAPEMVQWMSGAIVPSELHGRVVPEGASWEINGGGK